MSTSALPPVARRWPPLIILVLFLMLGVIYSVSTPVMEASDELRHYPFVRLLAEGGGLPVQRAGEPTLWGQEGSQPPLYYALMGALTSRVDASDLPGLMRLNPHAEVGVPLAFANKNQVLHTEQEAFPWRGAALAVHLIRLLSLLLGAGTVFCTYLLARELFPGRPAIAPAAMAVNAFLPMFLFISASVNNDTLVTLLSSIAVLLMVRLVLRGASWPRLASLGGVIGLASLSKLGALGLLPLVALALGLRVFVVEPGEAETALSLPRRITRWLALGLIVAMPALIVAGWWYLRNWQLYGDPTGLTAMLDIAGRRPVAPGLVKLLGEFQGFRINFWGLFGAVNVLMRPTWIYILLDLATVAALVGLVAWALTRWRAEGFANWPALLIPAAWIGIEFAGVVRWTSMTAASQGRLMFPAIGAICLFLALGWLGVWSPRGQRRGAALIAGGMFTLAALAPFLAIRPAYPRSSELLVQAVPATAHIVNMDFGAARLLAYEASADRLSPGAPLDVTLYWQALAPMAQDYSVYVQAFGWRQALDQQDSYPGGGAFPTSRWLPGQIIRDRHRLEIPADAIGPAPAWLVAGLYDFDTMTPLPVTGAEDAPVVFPFLDRMEIAPGAARLQLPHALEANFGGAARLTGYDASSPQAAPGEDWELTLLWEALAPMPVDYTVFVHVEDAAGRIVTQTDLQPTGGLYPTSAWVPGHTLKDTYRLTFPEDAPLGDYRVTVGLYDPATGARLPLLDAGGAPLDNQLVVTALRIEDAPADR